MMRKLFIVVLLLVSCRFVLGDDRIMELVSVNNRRPEEIQHVLESLLEPEEAIAVSGPNLILRASPRRLTEIKQLIQQLDTPLHNLLITVVQGQNLSAQELNVEADIRMSLSVTESSFRHGEIQGRVYQTQQHGSIQNSQTIRALEGQPALIKTGATVPVSNVTIYDVRRGNPMFIDTTSLVEATTGFEVIPHLTANEVVLSVMPWSDRMRADGAMDTQTASTQLRAKLGEWVEIGGSQETERSQRQGVLSTQQLNQSQLTKVFIKVEIVK